MHSEADKRFKSSPFFPCCSACSSHISCKHTTVPLVFWQFLSAITEAINIVCIVWEGSSYWKPSLFSYRDKACRQMICCILSYISSTLRCLCCCYPGITVKKEPCQNGSSIPSIPCISPFWLLYIPPCIKNDRKIQIKSRSLHESCKIFIFCL